MGFPRKNNTKRRLSGEFLELRLCLSAVRIVSWNTANRPNNAAEDADFQTVLQAIGNETVGGRTIPPSIVALQETDIAAFGGNSINRIESILQALFPQSDYQHAVTPLDSGDDANGFVYDDQIFDLVSTSIVQEIGSMQSFAHHIIRGQFRPDGTSGQSDFYIYSTHLKAGSSSENASRRTDEAAAIRADIDSLGAGQDVLVVGDFNISSSNEGAYQNFLASGNGQLFDPIDSPGDWKNNSAFVPIHTQNPAEGGAGGMDDRYDFQLGSAAVFDDQGLSFIDGSYRAFGNNGTHIFNLDITTGDGASPTVLSALAAASDHLPVVVDYEIDIDLAGLTIVETDGSTSVAESAAGDTYSLVLDTVPEANVTVTISTDGQTLVNGATTTAIEFTPADALIPKTVTITAVNDSIAEGNHQSVVTHALTSADAQYDTLPATTLLVTVADDESPTVVISEIMYNPASSEPDAEWVEIVNLGPGSVDLAGWWLDDEDTTDWGAIPAGGAILAANQSAVIHNRVISSAAFRDRWSVPEESLVIGVLWSSLANGPSAGNEILELRDATGVRQDVVNFDDDGVNWPSDNGESSIYLADPYTDNDQGGHWATSSVGVDGAKHPTGAPFNSDDVGSPGYVAGLDFTPPTIDTILFDHRDSDSQQRSMLRAVIVVFDTFVSVDTSAFELRKLGLSNPSDAKVDLNVTLNQFIDHSEAIIEFSGSHVDQRTGSLLDGNYEIAIDGSMITGHANGVRLDADGDSQPGGVTVIGDEPADAFFRLFGDRNGDRNVDVSDLAAFGLTYQKTASQTDYDELFDADADQDVDSRDFSELRRRLHRRLSSH